MARVLDTAADYGPDEWRTFAREIAYAPKRSFRFFAQDPATGLATDELAPSYARTLTRGHAAGRAAVSRPGTRRIA